MFVLNLPLCLETNPNNKHKSKQEWKTSGLRLTQTTFGRSLPRKDQTPRQIEDHNLKSGDERDSTSVNGPSKAYQVDWTNPNLLSLIQTKLIVGRNTRLIWPVGNHSCSLHKLYCWEILQAALQCIHACECVCVRACVRVKWLTDWIVQSPLHAGSVLMIHSAYSRVSDTRVTKHRPQEGTSKIWAPSL